MSHRKKKQGTGKLKGAKKEQHQKGIARVKKERGGEKGDRRRRPPRRSPPQWRGPWPKIIK